MIAGIFHEGSGLGNQLFRYIATRILAEEKGYEWGMTYTADGSGKGIGFKGASFMDIHGYYLKTEESSTLKKWNEWGKFCYDPDFNFVEDNTIIDGSFEDERYFKHRLPDIDQWLKVEPMSMGDNLCVIGFRGGEYYTVPELGLPKEYFDRAIAEMKKINPDMLFEVHTDDVNLAKQFFPDYPVIHDIGINWRSMRYAKYAIIANSSFYVIPRLLNGGLTIAPRYWNRYNTKKWDYPQSYYKTFKYI